MKLQTLLKLAQGIASESKCVSMGVGAVLVKEGHIISTGYNGTVKGAANCCEVHKERGPEHTEWSLKYEVHAEMNALLYCPVDTHGSIMVCTHSPCWNCTKHMVAAGVKEIHYGETYYREASEYSEVKAFCVDNGVILNEI